MVNMVVMAMLYWERLKGRSWGSHSISQDHRELRSTWFSLVIFRFKVQKSCTMSLGPQYSPRKHKRLLGEAFQTDELRSRDFYEGLGFRNMLLDRVRSAFPNASILHIIYFQRPRRLSWIFTFIV